MQEVASINTPINSHRNLKVWQKAIALVENIYNITQSFPKEEMYGLTSQIRRCAVSVPSNIAEGGARRSTKEFIRFINMSYASLSELETQLYISTRLNFIDDSTNLALESQIAELGRMLNGLRNSLQNKLNSKLPLNSELRTLDSEYA